MDKIGFDSEDTSSEMKFNEQALTLKAPKLWTKLLVMSGKSGRLKKMYAIAIERAFTDCHYVVSQRTSDDWNLVNIE